MPIPVKIQINSLAALERIIGADSELELEIRRNVAKAFSENLLKTSVDGSGILSAIKDSIAKEAATRISASIANFSIDGYGQIRNIQLRHEIKSRIEAEVIAHTEKLLTDAIARAWDERLTTLLDANKLDLLIAARVDRHINAEVDRKVKERLTAMLVQTGR